MKRQFINFAKIFYLFDIKIKQEGICKSIHDDLIFGGLVNSHSID